MNSGEHDPVNLLGRIKRNKAVIGGALLFCSRYISQGLALYLEDKDAGFFDKFSKENPINFELWRGFNHIGSSIAVGILGVSYYKSIFDPHDVGGTKSDILSVLLTTGTYSAFEAWATRRPDTLFSVEDVVATSIAASATVLVDRLIRRRKGVQDDFSLPE
jgi:hypothetical protein